MFAVRKKILLVICILLALVSSGCSTQLKKQKIPVKGLILPKFEQGEIERDFPGEAQLFYEEYLDDGDVYEIDGNPDRLYYKDNIRTGRDTCSILQCSCRYA